MRFFAGSGLRKLRRFHHRENPLPKNLYPEKRPMKTTAQCSRLLVLLAWLIMGPHAALATGQSLALELMDRDANSAHLRVTDANAANVNLQGSFDLENWFHIQSAVPVLGVADFAHTNTEPIDAWFFRAVAAPAPLNVIVGPQSDTNRFVAGLILPETGGRLEITDARGVFYQLTIGSNTVTEPTAIRMTVITNFASMPLSNRFRAAVAFEPDGFEFRGAAELKIRFPETIPALEMVGYGFDGSGGDFHLRPWDSNTNEVTLSVTHFSGAGVTAEPFSVGNPGKTYERGLTYTRDAIREADNWAGTQYRDVSRNRHEGNITQQQADNQRRLIKLQRNVRVYINAIKPLLAAAASDCEVGKVVLKRLDQLESESGVYGQGVFYQTALKVAPSIRCVCARYYLELCEKNLAASGTGATRGMDEVLDQVALMTGMVDDPNCDLGSNNQIQARLAQAKCHKPWEGTVRYTRVYTSHFMNPGAGPGGSYVVTAQDDLAYTGRITELLEEEGDVLDDGSTWQSWTLKLAGRFNANLVDSELNTLITPDWTLRDSDVTRGIVDLAAEGKIILRFDRTFFTSISVSAGLDGIRYRMPLRRTTERTVECTGGRDCPSAIPAETTNFGNQDLTFARSPNSTDPNAVVTWKDGSLRITYKRTTTEPFPEPSIGQKETVETLTVQLFRGSAQ